MSSGTIDRHLVRFRRALDYIDAHLDESLDVQRLSEVAGFSKYHFHRQFCARFGIGVSRFVQLTRLRRSSYRLAFRRERVIDVALAGGFEGPEAFARAFKKVTGQTPSEFREQPRWDAWYSNYEALDEMRRSHMQVQRTMQDVEIVDFKAVSVAALEYRGDVRHIGNSIRQFIAWRRRNGLSPDVSDTFNVVYRHPLADDENSECHYDLCASTERDVPQNPEGVTAKVIPGGRCALLTHVGSEATLGQSVSFLYRDWLPANGEDVRDFPLFFRRVKFFPDVPEHEAVVEIYLPLR